MTLLWDSLKYSVKADKRCYFSSDHFCDSSSFCALLVKAETEISDLELIACDSVTSLKVANIHVLVKGWRG